MRKVCRYLQERKALCSTTAIFIFVRTMNPYKQVYVVSFFGPFSPILNIFDKSSPVTASWVTGRWIEWSLQKQCQPV